MRVPSRHSFLAVLSTLVLTACGRPDEPKPDEPNLPDNPTPMPQQVGEVVALTTSGKLVSFNRAAPGTLVGSIAVTGLPTGESLVGIDYRPADSQLYGLTSGGKVVTLAPDTGVATVKSTLAAMSGDDNPFTALDGTDFGVDFNPVADRLRVVSNTGQNLRINVDTGATTTDGTINGGGSGSQLSGAAYTNSFPETVSTRLFVLDAATDTVYLQDPPNAGTLSSPVALGVDATSVNGYDIDARTNVGYAALTVGGASKLYRLELNKTPVATELAAIGGGEFLKGLALKQVGGATVVGLTADNRLVRALAASPNTLTGTASITGVPSGETLLGIDVRPSNGQLYALSSAGKLYTLDAQTGAATAKATLSADAADTTDAFTSLSGTGFVVDFNPVADRLRVVSNTGQNLRINADTGATTTDGAINRASGAAVVFGAAYTNSLAGASATSLFDLERNGNVLTRQDPPNNGTLVNVGMLGQTWTGAAGFDIGGGDNGLPLVAARTTGSGPFALYQVNLTTGAATFFPRTATTAEQAALGGASGPELRDMALLY